MNRKDYGLTTAERHDKCFPWKYLRFSELVLDGGFQSLYNKDISKDKKHFELDNIVKNIATIDVILSLYYNI